MGRRLGWWLAFSLLLLPAELRAQQVDQDFLIGAMRGELAAERAQGSRLMGNAASIALGVAASLFVDGSNANERNTYHGLALGAGVGVTAIGIAGADGQASPPPHELARVEAMYRSGYEHGYRSTRVSDVRVSNGVNGLLFIAAYTVTALLLDDTPGG